MKITLLLLLWVVLSGCVGDKAVYPDAQVAAVMRRVQGLQVPEYSADIFSESLAPVFRMAALQAVQFHQAKQAWPTNRAELESFLGTKSAQPYRLSVQPDGSLAIGWESDGEPLPAVVRLTPDYFISFRILPAAELSAAIRARRAKEEVQAQALGEGLGAGLRVK